MEAFRQTTQRRLRLPERPFLGFDLSAVAVPIAPDATVTGDPSALDFEHIQTLGAADDEVDLREAFVGMAGRLQGMIGREAIVEGGTQSLEYALLRLAAGVVGGARHHPHGGAQLRSFFRIFASVS